MWVLRMCQVLVVFIIVWRAIHLRQLEVMIIARRMRWWWCFFMPFSKSLANIFPLSSSFSSFSRCCLVGYNIVKEKYKKRKDKKNFLPSLSHSLISFYHLENGSRFFFFENISSWILKKKEKKKRKKVFFFLFH